MAWEGGQKRDSRSRCARSTLGHAVHLATLCTRIIPVEIMVPAVGVPLSSLIIVLLILLLLALIASQTQD